MNADQIVQVVNRYQTEKPEMRMAVAISLENGGAMRSHIQWMCVEIIKMTRQVGSDRLEKANRWLGFVQGYLWTTGIYTIEEMRGHNTEPEPEPELEEECYHLYKFSDGSKDKHGKSTDILLLSQPASDRSLRGTLGGQDHAGMDYADWDRVIGKGEITMVRNRQDIDDDWFMCLPYGDGTDFCCEDHVVRDLLMLVQPVDGKIIPGSV